MKEPSKYDPDDTLPEEGAGNGAAPAPPAAVRWDRENFALRLSLLLTFALALSMAAVAGSEKERADDAEARASNATGDANRYWSALNSCEDRERALGVAIAGHEPDTAADEAAAEDAKGRLCVTMGGRWAGPEALRGKHLRWTCRNPGRGP